MWWYIGEKCVISKVSTICNRAPSLVDIPPTKSLLGAMALFKRVSSVWVCVEKWVSKYTRKKTNYAITFRIETGNHIFPTEEMLSVSSLFTVLARHLAVYIFWRHLPWRFLFLSQYPHISASRIGTKEKALSVPQHKGSSQPKSDFYFS